MKYVVCYDVTDDRRRSRLSNTLLNYGARVQESVFVADLKPELAKEMEGKVRRLLLETQDKLHIFVLCQECQSKITEVGRAQMPVEEDFYIV